MSDIKKDKIESLVIERTEKLVTAVYLVSGLLEDSNPIKGKLRSESLSLLSLISHLGQEHVKDKIAVYQGIDCSLQEIRSLLFVAKMSGTISVMNSDLLVRGFETLSQFCSSKKTSLLEGIKTSEAPLPIEEGAYERDVVVEKQSFFDVKSKDSALLGIGEKGNSLRSAAQGAERVWARPKEGEIPRGVFKARKVGRREQILGVFVKGHDISIKDISSKVKGCSEKTIQRELNALVFDHILERIGEKRWSRYVLR